MYVRLALICVVLALACCTIGFCATDQCDPPPGLTVIGNAEVQGKPDVAFVTLGVTTEDKDAAKAAQENANRNSALISAVEKAGVSKTDIQTVNYSVTPRVDYQAHPPATTGYTVSNEVRVKVRDLTKVGVVIDAALWAGANYSQNLVFVIDDDTQLRKEALAKAATNATVKAQAIAQALGVKLGYPVSVVENGAQVRPVPIMRSMAAMDAAAPSPTPILPGENKVSASVTVQYAISPAK